MPRPNAMPPVPMNPQQAASMQTIPVGQPEVQDLVINHMPQLGGPGAAKNRVSLMPKTGGQVGVTYAIVPASKVKNAHDIGWRRPPRGAKPFTIRGPIGAVNCEVVQYGDPIPGIPTSSCRAYLLVDRAVWDKTGLDPSTGFALDTEPEQGGSTDGPTPPTKK